MALEATLETAFADPRAWVARKWLYRYLDAHRERRALIEAHRAARQGVSDYERRRAADAGRKARREREALPEFKLLQKLQAEVAAVCALRHKRLLAKHGEDPFPDLTARIGGVKSEGYGHLHRGEPFSPKVPFSMLYHTELEAGHLLKCAEAEKILLGQIAPSTAAKLAECERRAEVIVAAARKSHEAEEEARRRKEEEQARKYREQLERSRTPSAPADAPTAGQPAPPDPPPPSPLSMLLIDSNTLASTQPPPEQRPRPTVGFKYPLPSYPPPVDPETEALLSRWGDGGRRRPR